MDLRLFWAVAKRYKRISIGGTVLAAVLAIFAYGTPGPGGIKPRGSVTWESQAQLLITQASGPYGRADPKTIAAGSPGYMGYLSPIYAGLANGTAVQSQVRKLRMPGRVAATEGIDPQTGAYLPFVNLTAEAPTLAGAATLITHATTIFQNYVTQMEEATGAPAAARVSVEVLNNGLPPQIASKPKPTVPVLVFIAVLAGTIMLMFSLENRDPQSAAKLGRVPADLPHRDSAVAGITPILPSPRGHGAPGAHGDHLSGNGREPGERPAAVDRLLKRG
jgi:hypothetical protein